MIWVRDWSSVIWRSRAGVPLRHHIGLPAPRVWLSLGHLGRPGASRPQGTSISIAQLSARGYRRHDARELSDPGKGQRDADGSAQVVLNCSALDGVIDTRADTNLRASGPLGAASRVDIAWAWATRGSRDIEHTPIGVGLAVVTRSSGVSFRAITGRSTRGWTRLDVRSAGSSERGRTVGTELRASERLLRHGQRRCSSPKGPDPAHRQSSVAFVDAFVLRRAHNCEAGLSSTRRLAAFEGRVRATSNSPSSSARISSMTRRILRIG